MAQPSLLESSTQLTLRASPARRTLQERVPHLAPPQTHSRMGGKITYPRGMLCSQPEGQTLVENMGIPRTKTGPT